MNQAAFTLARTEEVQVHICCVDDELLKGKNVCPDPASEHRMGKEKGIIRSQVLCKTLCCRTFFTPELHSNFTNYIFHEGDFIILALHLRKLRHSRIK